MSWQKHLHKFVKSPYLQGSIGALLLFVSLIQIFDFNVKHSIALIGIWHLLQTLPNILQALERIARWRK